MVLFNSVEKKDIFPESVHKPVGVVVAVRGLVTNVGKRGISQGNVHKEAAAAAVVEVVLAISVEKKDIFPGNAHKEEEGVVVDLVRVTSVEKRVICQGIVHKEEVVVTASASSVTKLVTPRKIARTHSVN